MILINFAVSNILIEMEQKELFKKLWSAYTEITPSAQAIHDLFAEKGDQFNNDHVALRTFDDPRVNIDVVAKTFIAAGYEEKEEYSFPEKKLKAKHFQHKTDDSAPLVFISQLILDECSVELQSIIKNALNSVEDSVYEEGDLALKGRVWDIPSYEMYQKLREESEYAAWTYVYGFVVNHFTVDINSLVKFETIQEVNQFLKDNGYKLNTSGGEVKGTPEVYLEQSSILADMKELQFEEGAYKVPTCFYEFARRHAMDNGELFMGFIAASANKIFESTDLAMQ